MNQTPLQRLDRVLFWMSGTALTALAAALSSGFLLVSAMPLWAIAGWRQRRGGEPVSRGASAGLAALVFALLVLAVTTDPRNFIQYFSMCLGGLVLVKLFDQREVGDRSLLLCCGAALVVGAALLHSSLIIGIVLLAFLLLAFPAAGLLQIALAEDRAGRVAKVRSRGWRPVSLGMWGAALASMAIMVMIFVLMPRGFMAAPAALAGAGSGRDMSGFDTEITLNTSGNVNTSYEPVLEIRPAGGGDDLARVDALYLRGAVLDEYSDGWQRASRDRERRTLRFSDGFATVNELGSGTTRVEITYVGERMERLFTLGRTGTIRLDDADGALLTLDEHSGEIAVQLGDVTRYTIESDVRPRLMTESPPMSEAAYPERVADHARALLSEIDVQRPPAARHDPEDERIVRYFERHLRTNYGYTTERPPAAPGEDPLVAFFFTHRVGHCEYFATALTGLARSVGIEARVVTGFLTSERLDDGGFIARNAHAHAWVEAHVSPGVWMRFDASPPGDVAASQQPPSGVAYALRRSWGWLSDLWVRSVVSYDSGSQRALLGEGYERFLDAAAGRQSRRGNGALKRILLRAVGAAAAAFAITLAVGLLAPIVAQRLQAGRARSGTPGGVEGALLRADRLLARAGLERASSAPPRAHARRVMIRWPSAGLAYDELAALHYRLRFGGSDEPRERAGAMLERLRAALREETA